MSMSDTDRQTLLRSIGINPDAASLAAPAVSEPVLAPLAQPEPVAELVATPATEPVAQPMATPMGPALAPAGIDPRAMAVTEIVFDPALLDGFTTLTGDDVAAASRYVFGLYRSHGRNRDRNSLLHREIGLFITRVRRARASGGAISAVRAAVTATAEQRDIAALLAAKGITMADLAALLV